MIVELFKKNRRLSWQSMMEIDQEEFPDAGFSVTLNLYRKIKRLYDKSQKMRGTEENNLREGAFTLLVDRATYISTKLEESARKKVMRQELETVNTESENRVLKRKLTEEIEYSSQLGSELDSLKEEYEQNLLGLSQIEHQYGQLISKLVQNCSQIMKKQKRN